jgi:hypothetical protein
MKIAAIIQRAAINARLRTATLLPKLASRELTILVPDPILSNLSLSVGNVQA